MKIEEFFAFLEKYDLFDGIPGGDLSYTKKEDNNCACDNGSASRETNCCGQKKREKSN